MSQPAATVDACVKSLPNTVKVGAYDWAVILMAEGEGDNNVCGEADFAVNHLRLWPTRLTSPGHAVGILLHECLHVIFDNQGLEQLKRGKDEREEQIIMGFEAGLISLLRDNPKLVTWMKRWLR